MFLTNSFGVAWNAEPIYVEVITRFNSFQAGIALRSFMGRKIRNKLDESLSQQKTELVELVRSEADRPPRPGSARLHPGIQGNTSPARP